MLAPRIAATSWMLHRSSTIRLDGSPLRQQLAEEGQLTLQWERAPNGALHGRGTVTGYRLETTGQDGSAARPPMVVPSLAVQVVVDSAQWRLVPEPPPLNECEREEMSAARLAGMVAVRIPDGVTVGSQWRDSTSSVDCRAGVAIRVTRVSRSAVVQWTGDTVTVARELSVRLEGRGGHPFQTVRLEGEGTEAQRLLVSESRGVTLRGTGNGTLRLRTWSGDQAQRLTEEVAWRINP